VHDRRLGDGLGSGLAEALDRVEIREDRELTNEDLGRLADRVARPIASRGSIEPSVVTSRTSLS